MPLFCEKHTPEVDAILSDDTLTRKQKIIKLLKLTGKCEECTKYHPHYQGGKEVSRA